MLCCGRDKSGRRASPVFGVSRRQPIESQGSDNEGMREADNGSTPYG
jgi:hypothetical protein